MQKLGNIVAKNLPKNDDDLFNSSLNYFEEAGFEIIKKLMTCIVKQIFGII